MNGEIRDLKAGTYWSEDGTALTNIKKIDNGVIIEIADLVADVFYEFVINEKGKTVFNCGQVSKTQKEQ